MLKQCTAVFLLFLFLQSTFAGEKKLSPHVPPKSMQLLQSFNHIQIDGDIHVNLHTGYKQPRIVIHGDPRDLAYLEVIVADNILYVNLGDGYPHFGPVTVDIRSNRLSSFSYKGTGVILGTRLQSKCLDLMINNQGKTKLAGNISLRKVELTGKGYTEIYGANGFNTRLVISQKAHLQIQGTINVSEIEINDDAWISMFWVSSASLIIREHGNAFVQLAGTVNRLDLEAWNNARFKGRYLRARRAFVKTFNAAVAEINVYQHQHALASDQSDIHYFYIPETKADFMAFNGAILDYRDLKWPIVQEWTRYNK